MSQDQDGHAGPSDLCAAWLSLESGDNEPDRFLSYLFSAFHSQDLTQDLAQDLAFSGMWDWDDFSLIEPLLSDWINRLAVTELEQLILVLDDYHRINRPVIHRITQFLLDHRPGRLHLIITTREDPPLSLARLRVRDELTELRARDLSFTQDEAEAFFRWTMKLTVQSDSVWLLTERTEGWIAGLQLAALSIRKNQNAPALLEDLQASHRFLVDYLMEEVLQAQPDSIRQFLFQTAHLKRFSADLCNAVTGRHDSGAVLKTLEKNNLFLIPLDDQRNWYRYHHLFAECLRKEAALTHRLSLYHSTARWCAGHGFFEEAVEYALDSSDFELAAETIETILNNPGAWSSGHLGQLESWLRALPDTVVHCRPKLQIVAARALYLTGKFDQAEALLDRASHILNSEGSLCQGQEDLAILQVQVGIYRASIMAVNGRLAVARTLVLEAMDRMPAGFPHIEARGLDTLAIIDMNTGRLEQAESGFLAAADMAEMAGVAYLSVNARCEAAMVRLVQGRLNEAEELCRDTLAQVNEARGPIPPAGLAWAILGNIFRERHELERATCFLDTAIELAREGGLMDDLQQAYLGQARLQLARGNPGQAQDFLKKSLLILKSFRMPRLIRLSQALEAWAALQLGDLPSALKISRQLEREGLASNPDDLIHERERLTVARVLLAENQLAEARHCLAPVCLAARNAGRNGSLMEALVLLAQIAWRQGDESECCQHLAEAIGLARPQGYVRLFADEGTPMRQMIAACLKHKGMLAFRPYCERVLAAMEPADQTDFPERISPQELRILRMIAEGESNQMIAARLNISLGTAKWHIHNLYAKLEVSSRTQAINRGRELGLS
jgi:LuxR family maltose regulon positive regulatory protein